MRKFLQVSTAVVMTTGLMLTGAATSQASDLLDPGDVDTAPPVSTVLPPDEAAGAGVTLTATFSCMKAQGEVPATSTAAEVLGAVTESGVSIAPTGTPVSPSPGCINGALVVVADNVNTTTDARYAFSLRVLERNIVAGRTPVPPVAPQSEDTVTVMRVPEYNPCGRKTNATLAQRRSATITRGLTNSISGFITARGVCDPKYLNWSTDECSIGDPVNNGPYNFKNACLRHDFNYRNLQDLNAYFYTSKALRNKARADSKFTSDMGVQCRSVAAAGSSKLKACYTVAAAYASAVRVYQRNTTDMYPSGNYEW